MTPLLTHRLGIIPACAGSTRRTARRASRPGDHPRMRGEHLAASEMEPCYEGSSPHARGALRQGPHRRTQGGIIPACAGSTAPCAATRRSPRDHPRMRGEHLWPALLRSHRRGSSPHARGAHFATSASGRHSRLIHSLFASSGHPSSLSSDYIFARRDTCWHCSNPWRAHRQASRHQYRSVGE